MSTLAFVSDPRNFTYHRLSAQPLTIAPVTERTTVDPASLHVSITDAVRPSSWRFAAVPDFVRDPRYQGFELCLPRSVVAPTVADVYAWLNAGLMSYDTLSGYEFQPDSPEAALCAAEIPVFKKLTQQVGVNVSWFLGHGYARGYTNQHIPSTLTDIMRHVAAVYARNYIQLPSKPDPALTNPGWPCFTGPPAGKIVSVLCCGADPDPSRVMESANNAALRFGLDQRTALAFGMGGRSGPMYKDTPSYRYSGRRTHEAWAIGKGWSQRNRVVQMASNGGNRVVRSLYERLSHSRRNVDGLWHAGTRDFNVFQGLPYHYEADISGYDQSVSPELQDMLAMVWTEQWPELAPAIKCWRMLEARPLITPSWDYDDYHVAIVHSLGGTRSGLKLTTEVGTFLEVCVTLYALHRQGLNYLNFPWRDTGHGGDIVSLHAGDDVRISTRRRLDVDKWTADFAELGFKCELVVGDGFLSRHTSPTFPNVPIAGRVVQQTMSNESERTGRRTLGLHYLGFRARTERFELLPEFLQRETWSCIRHAAWIRELAMDHDFNSVNELRSVLATSPRVQERIASALESAAGLSWFDEQLREADHSTTSRYAVEMAQTIKANLSVDSSSIDKQIDALSSIVGRLPLHTRMSLAYDGYHAVGAGATEGLKWLKHVAVKYGKFTTDAATAALVTDLEVDLDSDR